MDMALYVVNKLMRLVLMLVLVSIVVFLLSHAIPGGPEAMLSQNPKVSAEDIARIRSNFGLDKPVYIQYLHWFWMAFLHLDFGMSYVTGEPVRDMIISHLPATVELMATAFVIALIGAVVVGALWSRYSHGLIDEFLSILSTAGMSIPVFWLGIMAIALFSIRLGWLPAGGTAGVTGPVSIMQHIRHLVLPASVLALAYFSTWSRYVRSGMIDVSSAGFIMTARAKGLSEGMVLFKHALKNAALPFVTIALMQVPTIFAGAVVTETIFSWPGMGRLFYEGLERHDYSRVMGIVVISAFLVILFNTVADLVLKAIDPRVDFKESGNGTGWGRAFGVQPVEKR